MEQQKEHFPHYFNPLEKFGTLDWTGTLPPYNYFEPRRTSLKEWEAMATQFRDHNWNFLEISRSYIKGDVVSLHQILVTYFKNLHQEFQINPLDNLSVPGIAFKTWKTHQLPLLKAQGLCVRDFSRDLDPSFRAAYHGGIVDVYRPHLVEGGYYYDVKSLYPTAMLNPMPVGEPTLVNLTPQQFLEGSFFGYVRATVKAPSVETPAGYIGLLPISYQGRLVNPGGTFEGLFFSEELRFALKNGYELVSTGAAFEFQRGENTFTRLIQKLNPMKIEAQKANKPVLRNIAKLLMNSLYGRFGMHPNTTQTMIVTPQQFAAIQSRLTVTNFIDFGEVIMVTFIPELASQSFITKAIRSNGVQPLKIPKESPAQTNVPIAATVTAYSRIIINQYKLDAMNLGLELYYSDTDSLVLNGPLPPNYINETKLGLLKLEHEIEEGFFVAPKIYLLKTKEGKIVTRCKGYPGDLTLEEVQELYEGRSPQTRYIVTSLRR